MPYISNPELSGGSGFTVPFLNSSHTHTSYPKSSGNPAYIGGKSWSRVSKQAWRWRQNPVMTGIH